MYTGNKIINQIIVDTAVALSAAQGFLVTGTSLVLFYREQDHASNLALPLFWTFTGVLGTAWGLWNLYYTCNTLRDVLIGGYTYHVNCRRLERTAEDLLRGDPLRKDISHSRLEKICSEVAQDMPPSVP